MKEIGSIYHITTIKFRREVELSSTLNLQKKNGLSIRLQESGFNLITTVKSLSYRTNEKNIGVRQNPSLIRSILDIKWADYIGCKIHH